MRRFRFKIAFIFIIPLAIALFTFIVMSLWNSILVAVLHVGIITFWQALGILVLSKILFGGFHGRGRGRFGGPGKWRGEDRKEMFEKLKNMTPEERMEFKRNWKSRCASWKNADEQTGNMKESTTM